MDMGESFKLSIQRHWMPSL